MSRRQWLKGEFPLRSYHWNGYSYWHLRPLSFAAHLQIDEENKHYIEAKKSVVYNLLIKKAIHLYFPSRMVIL